MLFLTNNEQLTEQAEIFRLTDLVSVNFTNCHNQELFTLVYPPIIGIMELMYHRQNHHEITALLPYFKSEVGRKMTTESIQWAFTNPEEVIESMKNMKVWELFTLGKFIVMDETTPEATKKQQSYNTKRHRTTKRTTYGYNESQSTITNEQPIPVSIRTTDIQTVSTNTTTTIQDITTEVKKLKENYTKQLETITQEQMAFQQSIRSELKQEFANQETAVQKVVITEMTKHKNEQTQQIQDLITTSIQNNNAMICTELHDLRNGINTVHTDQHSMYKLMQEMFTGLNEIKDSIKTNDESEDRHKKHKSITNENEVLMITEVNQATQQPNTFKGIATSLEKLKSRATWNSSTNQH
jgi:hypothetical protein